MNTWPGLIRFMVAVGRRFGASLLLVVLAVLIFVSTTATQHLQYDRKATQMGEFWRLITGHWTHWSFDHLLWDVFAFAVLAGLCEQAGRTRLLACIITSSLSISLGVMVVRPDMPLYRGLSGIDSSLFVLVALEMIKRSLIDGDRQRMTVVGACLVAFMLKVLFELSTGTTVFVDSAQSGMVPLPLAHIIGAGVGFLFAVSWPCWRSPSSHYSFIGPYSESATAPPK